MPGIVQRSTRKYFIYIISPVQRCKCRPLLSSYNFQTGRDLYRDIGPQVSSPAIKDESTS